ncbi:MAG: hypothetical protein CHACPFDD_00023 [Phycisphaerae bacterium]|nr:hypothetical protein [Phycisphaerae bacterium]
MTTARRVRFGFSLVETVISALIVGVALVAALNTLGGVEAARVRSVDRVRAGLLADGLIAEICGQAYEESGTTTLVLGPEAGEKIGTSRAAFDDVDDYNGLNDKPPCGRDGSAMGDYSGWRIQAAAAWVNPVSLNNSLTETGYKLITVTVTTPAGESVSRLTLSAKGASGLIKIDLGGGKLVISAL